MIVFERKMKIELEKQRIYLEDIYTI